MKKTKLWNILMLVVMMMPLVASCGDDDEKNGNNADIAITGSCIEVGGNHALVEGYFNQKNITVSYSSLQVGVEYSTDESFKGSKFVQSKVIEGNRFEVEIKSLKTSTDYYYRTCVIINSLNYVGKTRTFTTKEKADDEIVFPDYEGGTKAYFAYQNPIRTLVLGTDIYDNTLDGGRDAVIDVIIDESLCDNLWFIDKNGNVTKPVLPMPHAYYNYDEVKSTVIKYNGETRGYLEIQFTDKFFQDPKTTSNDTTYVIPVRMVKATGIDAILSGTPNTSNPVRQNAKDWSVLPMDYVLYCVRYMNPWQGKYIRRGVDMVTENGGDVERYSKMDPSNPVNQYDEICGITTKNMTQAIFPVSFKTSGASISCNLLLTFNGNQCTISTEDEGVTVTGSGEYIIKGTEKSEYKDYQWGSINGKLVQRDILRLAYQVDFSGTGKDIQIATADTMVVQTRESNKREWFDYKYNDQPVVLPGN